jgi:hypothetical protein
VSVIGFLAVDSAHKNKECNVIIMTIIIVITSSVPAKVQNNGFYCVAV